MTPKEFIHKRLDILADDFPQVKIKYGYNDLIDIHVVVLTPEKEYYENSKLDDTWIPISEEFGKEFPSETITFVSSDSTLAEFSPEYEWNNSKCIWNSFEESLVSWDIQRINKIFEKALAKHWNYIDFPEKVTVINAHHLQGSYFLNTSIKQRNKKMDFFQIPESYILVSTPDHFPDSKHDEREEEPVYTSAA